MSRSGMRIAESASIFGAALSEKVRSMTGLSDKRHQGAGPWVEFFAVGERKQVTRSRQARHRDVTRFDSKGQTSLQTFPSQTLLGPG